MVYYQQGKHDEALSLYSECLKGRKTRLGLSHPDTLNTMLNMAIVYYKQGKYDEALSLYSECLKGRKTRLGPDHPHTLRTMNNMAVVYRNQGKYDEALSLYSQCLEGSKTRLGPDHPDTLSTMRNIAIINPFCTKPGLHENSMECVPLNDRHILFQDIGNPKTCFNEHKKLSTNYETLKNEKTNSNKNVSLFIKIFTVYLILISVLLGH